MAEQKKGLSRRDALKVGLFTGFGFSLGKFWGRGETDQPGQLIHEAGSQEPQSSYELFAENGITEWHEFFQTADRMYQEFGVTIFRRYTEFCSAVARGVHSSEDLELFGHGWGERIGNYREDIDAKINSLQIDEATPEEIEVQRQFLHRFADVLPYHCLSLPDLMIIKERTGGSMGADMMRTSSFSRVPENAVISLAHESEHSFQSAIQRIKPYMSLQSYVSYLSEYTNTVHRTFSGWLRLPLEQAMQYKEGRPLLNYGVPNEDEDPEGRQRAIEQLERWEQSLLTTEERATIATIENFNARYSNLVYVIGNRMREDQSLKTNADANDLMESAVEELAHFFVGPVQSPENGSSFPRSENDFVPCLLQLDNLALQRRRFALFSPDYGFRSFTDIRAHLFGEDAQETPQVEEQFILAPYENSSADTQYGTFTATAEDIIRDRPFLEGSHVGNIVPEIEFPMYGIERAWIEERVELGILQDDNIVIQDGKLFIETDNTLWMFIGLPTGDSRRGWVRVSSGSIAWNDETESAEVANSYHDEDVTIGTFTVQTDGRRAYIRQSPVLSDANIQVSVENGAILEIRGINPELHPGYSFSSSSSYPYILSYGYQWVHVRDPESGYVGWISANLGDPRFG